MTKAQKIACRLRHIILVVGILFTIAGIIWAILPLLLSSAEDFAGLFGTVLIINRLARESELAYGINVVIVLGLLLLAQWAFLRPGKGWTIRMVTVGRPLKTSIFAAGVIAMLLSTGPHHHHGEAPFYPGRLARVQLKIVHHFVHHFLQNMVNMVYMER